MRRPHSGGSGRRSGCDSDHVLDLIRGDAEIGRDLVNGITSLKSIDKVLHAGSAVNDKRQAKRDSGIDDYLGICIGR